MKVHTSSLLTIKGCWADSFLISLLFMIVLGGLLVGNLPVAGAAEPITNGYRSSINYGSTCSSTPTGEKPESKLWFNDGIWWASLCKVLSPTVSEYRIHKFIPASQGDPTSGDWVDTGTLLDNRPNTKADTLWDGNKLYVVSHSFTSSGAPSSSPSNWGRLYRYSYDVGTKTYSLDSGFPINVTQGKSETLTIAKDSTGRLWVTYVESKKVMVNHSCATVSCNDPSSDTNWSTPFSLPVSDATNLSSDDISAIIAFNGRIGILWSNQATRKMYFAVHADSNDLPTSWTGGAIYAPGGSAADDHINLKTYAGKVYAVTKTSFDSSNQPQINLLVCDIGSDSNCTSLWQDHPVYLGRDGDSRPILFIDTDACLRANSQPVGELNVFTVSAGGSGYIAHKETCIDDINFPSGNGTAYIQSSTDIDINNPASTKQNIAGKLLVIASDQNTKNYFHNGNVGGGGGGGDTTPPTVSLTAPADGSTVSGAAVPVTADASDNVGVVGVQFLLDGAPLGAEDTTVPYSINWDSTPATNGPHTLSARARDAAGNTTTATAVTVTIANGGGSTPQHMQTVTGGSSSSATVATSAGLTAVTNDLYLAAVTTRPYRVLNSVSGLGLAWTKVKAQCARRNQTGIEVWMARGTPTGDGIVTANWSSPATNAVIAVSRYSGVSSPNPVGNTVSGNTLGMDGACPGGSDTTWDTNAYSFNLTTTAANSVVYGAVAMRNKTHTPGAGYTERVKLLQQGTSGEIAGSAVEDRTVASPSTVLVNGTFSGAVDWAFIGLEIKP